MLDRVCIYIFIGRIFTVNRLVSTKCNAEQVINLYEIGMNHGVTEKRDVQKYMLAIKSPDEKKDDDIRRRSLR